MRPRSVVGVALAAVLVTLFSASAQEARPLRVAVILQGGPWYDMVDGLRENLRELGLSEGRHLVLEIHDTRGDLKAVEEVASKIEAEKGTLLVTTSTSVSLAAKKATKNIPIVFAAGTDPVAVKLADSIRRPGGRFTGVHFLVTDLTGKRLELLREMVPSVRRVLTFYDPSNASAIESAKEGREAAGRLGLEFIERKVASVDEFHRALNAIRVGEADAYFAVSDAMVGSQTRAIVEMGRSKRLPTMSFEPSFVVQGGLASYSSDFKQVGRAAAKYVQQILAGANPADLPVERIDRVALVVNLKTAEHIGVVIPDSILARADKLIE
jgi:putative ABC transport system substrate-binding protein